MTTTGITRALAAVAIVVLLVGEVTVMRSRSAHADQGAGLQYNVDQPVAVDEATAVAPDPALHIDLRALPGLCSEEPQCRLFVIDLHYPSTADIHQSYFTTISAVVHGSGRYALQLWADPLTATGHEVGDDTSLSATPHVNLITTRLDPDQEYGVEMYMYSGVATPFTLIIRSSTQSFPNPLESLNPVPTPSTIPPALPVPATTVPAESPVTTAPQAAPAAVPPPPVAAPDQALGGPFIDTGSFNQGLAAPISIFKRTAETKPPGKPDPLQLWLALLALPVGLFLLFPVLIARRRRGELL